MSVEDDQVRVLNATLPHVSFEGWTEKALRLGSADAGLGPDAWLRLFPDGALDAIRLWSAESDLAMVGTLDQLDLSQMRIRDRIAASVRARLDVVAAHKEAVRRTLSFLALPWNAASGTRLTYNSVNAMWYAVGDTATDLSWYSKRATLSAVYGATVLYWLDDTSEDCVDTWAFLDRRIEDVMKLMKVRAPGLGAGLSSLVSRCDPLAARRS